MDMNSMMAGISMASVATWGLKILGALALLMAAHYLARFMNTITCRALRRTKYDDMLVNFAGKVVFWLVLILGITVCLSTFGLEVASIVAVLASSFFAVGLALQNSLANFAAGVMILVLRPFKVGDFIVVAGQSGTVKLVDLLTTAIDTPDHRRIIIPNGSIFGSTIENISFHDKRRVDIQVGTDYQADLALTRRVLHDAIHSLDQIDADPEPKIALLELADSSVNWSIRIWCDKDDYFTVKEQALVAIKTCLDHAGIGIPFPQMALHFSAKDWQPVQDSESSVPQTIN